MNVGQAHKKKKKAQTNCVWRREAQLTPRRSYLWWDFQASLTDMHLATRTRHTYCIYIRWPVVLVRVRQRSFKGHSRIKCHCHWKYCSQFGRAAELCSRAVWSEGGKRVHDTPSENVCTTQGKHTPWFWNYTHLKGQSVKYDLMIVFLCADVSVITWHYVVMKCV